MADYQGVLADLRAKLMSLDQERAALEAAILAIERLIPSARSRTFAPTNDVQVSARAFVGLTMPQAIIRVLKLSGAPMTKGQIKAAILSGGIAGGSNIGSHIYNTLHRLSQAGGPIERLADNQWGLAEWSQAARENPSLLAEASQ